jgi:hypothetical protein
MSTLIFDTLSQMQNSTASLKYPVDAKQFFNNASPIGCFTKISNEWKSGTNTDFNIQSGRIASLTGTSFAASASITAPVIGSVSSTLYGDGSNLTNLPIPESSGDTLAVLEQRVNNAQAGVGSAGSNEGILDAYTEQPWRLLVSGAITAGANSATLTNTGGLINIIPNRSYVIQDADATVNGKQETIFITAVNNTTIASPGITINGTFQNSYAANAFVSETGSVIANNAMRPNATTQTGHTAYTKNVKISTEEVEAKTDGKVEVSWRLSEKWFWVSGMSDATTITVDAISGDNGIFAQYYEGTRKFQIALIKVDKYGDRIVAIKSPALSGANFKVFDLSGAPTGTTTVTIPLDSTNPVYNTSEITTERVIIDNTSKPKWIVLPLTVEKEISAVDQAALDSWLEVTIEKILIKGQSFIFLDNFNRTNTDGDIGNGWTRTNLIAPQGTYSRAGIVSNELYAYGAQSSGTWTVHALFTRSDTVYSLGSDVEFSGIFRQYSPQYTYATTFFSLNIGVPVNAVSTGFTVLFDVVGNKIEIKNGTNILSATGGFTPNSNANYYFRVQILGKLFKIKYWLTSVNEPVAWNIIYLHSNPITSDNNYGGVSIYAAGAGATNHQHFIYMDNLQIQKINHVLIRGSAATTGTANKLSTRTTLWSKARANSIPLELGSQAILQ